MTITRPHHPFQAQSLEVLRHAHMRGHLQFVLILPDGSKSLIPADWTDFNTATCSPQNPQLIESIARQYALADKACQLGWSKQQVVIIDEDLGLSGSSTDKRSGLLFSETSNLGLLFEIDRTAPER